MKVPKFCFHGARFLAHLFRLELNQMTLVVDLMSSPQNLLAWSILLLANGESASWRCADTSCFTASVADNFAVDSA